MNIGTLLKTSFIASLCITIVGAFLKITDAEGAVTLLVIGVIVSLVFIVAAIYEVNTSNRIDRTEKLIWTIGFILMSGIAGIVYFLSGRKRIVSNS